MTSVNVTTQKNTVTVQQGDATTVTVTNQGPQGATGADGAGISAGDKGALTVAANLTDWTLNKPIDLGDNEQIRFGDSHDLAIFHNSTDSFIENITGNLHIRPKTAEEGIKLIPDAQVELYYNNSLRFATRSWGVEAPSQTFQAANLVAFGGYVHVNQDNQPVKVGVGGDLSLLHDGTDSKITNITGNLLIEAKSGETAIKAIPDGAVELYHNGTKKAETSADGFDLPDNSKIQFGDSQDLSLLHDGAGSKIENLTGSLNINTVSSEIWFSKGTSEYLARFITDGAVEAYFDGIKRSSTTSTGFNVFGTNIKLKDASNTELIKIYHSGSGGHGLFTCEIGDIKIQPNEDGGQVKLFETTSGSTTVRVTTTNNGITVNGTVTESSDVALKENIQPLSNALDKVKQLTGYKFNFKNTTNKTIGVIAQDVEKVFPELVHGEEGEKSLQYSGLIGALIESIKELSAKVTALENQ